MALGEQCPDLSVLVSTVRFLFMAACGRAEISISGGTRPRVIEVVLNKNAGFPFITLDQSFSTVLIQDNR